MRVPSLSETLAAAERLLREHGRVALCQIVRTEGSTPGKPGWKLALAPGGEAAGNLGGGAFEALVKDDARVKLAEAKPRSEVKRYYLTEKAVRGEPTGMVCGGLAEVFIEVLTESPMLVICGGGPVGQALAANAALCGFELLVAEDRAEFRRPELFPEGTRFAAVDREFSQDFLAADARRELSAAVVTRCWETDLSAAASILRQAPPGLVYLGLMGSRRKVDRVASDLTARGFDLGAVNFHAPIGVPIGGDSPGEIAVSILAEVIRERRRVRPDRGAESTEPARPAFPRPA